MNINEIVKSTGGRLVGTGLNKSVSGISIDSRTIKRGEVFLAIKGGNHDGRDFIEEALLKGASGVVSSRRPPRGHRKTPVMVVPDTLKALGDIALFYRRRFNIPVIGITGSNGKTTLKEMIAHILEAEFSVLKNKGTENNFIGLPLTLLRLKKGHEVAVLEMGASRTGEIDRLSRILRPTIAVITNIGPSHLEYFGGLNSVLKAKSEVLRNMPENSWIVLNGDDRLLAKIDKGLNSVTFGMGPRHDFKATNIKEGINSLEFDLSPVRNDKLNYNRGSKYGRGISNGVDGRVHFKLNLAGRHNIYNALAGIAVASILGVDIGTMQKRLSHFRALPMRMRMDLINRICIIDDTYNSNPLSSECAIQFLSGFKTKGRKIFVTGDMFELGRRAKYFHREIGKLVTNSRIDKLITVGRLSSQTALAARESGMKAESICDCPSTGKAADLLMKITRPGDTVLIKGSRAMGMERIVENLKCKSQKLK